ncbi:farnesol dehydrogenase-like [Euwallacea similis]|uniref:farnesol dehydrogenase-like n=1 Tax=Euwallacea similis TaxID=1736056 RepID=UPI00344CC049
MDLSIDQWVGKLAVVTGASAGIGAAIAKKLVECGIDVVGLARREEKVQELSKDIKNTKAKLYAIRCDVTNEEDVKRAFATINTIAPVHILINNAGVAAKTYLHNGEVSDWKNVLDTNVIGACLPSKEAIKSMSDNKVDGQIININSILGHEVYNIPKASVYIASKHALTALTESLRLELIGIGSRIKITSLSPGPVDDTELFVKKNVNSKGNNLLKYFLKPEDVVQGVLYVLTTAPHFHVAELMLRPVGEPL